MNLNALMRQTTLRQMRDAEQLWSEYPGRDGVAFRDALAAGSYDAIAATVAAKLRRNGRPDCTIDDALDLEIDLDDETGDAEGESTGGTGVEPVSPLGSGG